MKNIIAQKLKNDSEFFELNNLQLAEKYNCSKATINRAIKLAGLKKEVSKLKERKYTPKSKKEIFISEKLHEIIVGSLLGDGYITPYKRTSTKSKARNRNSSLIIKHGEKQKEYCLYKKELIEKHIGCYFREMEKKDIRFKNPEYKQYTVETTQNLIFNNYRDLWYKDKKIIPFENFKLTPLTLAIWFMDDGCNGLSGYLLCTNSFTFDEVNYLRKELLNLKIETNLRIQKKQPMIYIKSNSVKTFNNLILPYIHESMEYKLIFKP